jgi:hypothetical protein
MGMGVRMLMAMMTMNGALIMSVGVMMRMRVFIGIGRFPGSSRWNTVPVMAAPGFKEPGRK